MIKSNPYKVLDDKANVCVYMESLWAWSFSFLTHQHILQQFILLEQWTQMWSNPSLVINDFTHLNMNVFLSEYLLKCGY